MTIHHYFKPQTSEPLKISHKNVTLFLQLIFGTMSKKSHPHFFDNADGSG